MISARFPPLPATSTVCSVATARAASSARRLKAACAPIASDTVPNRNATSAIVRRETGSLLTVITVNPGRCQRRACLVAPQLPGVLGLMGLLGGGVAQL